MTEASRRGSLHTVQGFCVSMLPQVRHTAIFSIAVWIAAASGLMSCSRFLMRCKAARRADRGPSPGRRASSWISRSISGPAMAAGIEETASEREPGRERQTAGQGLHLLLQQCLGLAPGIRMRGDHEVLDDLLFIRLHQRGIDID